MKKGFVTFLVIVLLIGLVLFFVKDKFDFNVLENFQLTSNPLITIVGIIIGIILLLVIGKAFFRFIKTSFGR